MSLSIEPELIDQIKQDEGLRLKSYWDPIGKCWTLAYGHTGPDVQEGSTCTPEEADAFLLDDINTAANDLDAALPWAEKMGVVRWSVFVNMAFNMGIDRLLGFPETLAAAQAGDYEKTAAGMLDSLWAKQVGGRATQLAQQMRTGEWVNG
jgi:lysozyme